MNSLNPQTVLCIPGNWKDRTDLITQIASHNLLKYIFAGKALLNVETQVSFELEFYKRDERLKQAFQHAGMVNQVSERFLKQIDAHTSVVYILAETGSIHAVREVAEAGNAILNAGGLGVKVDSAGKAFTKAHWQALLEDFESTNLYQMFVLDSITDGLSMTHSCGMHNLGFKDTIVYHEKFQEAVHLISTFHYYQIIDKPEIKAEQTFSIDANSPAFIILEEKNQPYAGDELFGNPYGMWRLDRIE